MSLAERIARANDGRTAHLVRFEVAGVEIGRVRPEMARTLLSFDRVFARALDRLTLAPALDDPACPEPRRTAAVEGVLRVLAERGLVRGWRDERFALASGFDAPPLLLVERAALGVFGARGYGVHVNGLTRRAGRVHMWLARRAADRTTYPGALDQMVAGGQPAGLGVIDNLVKECAEEAGLGNEVARTARPAGTVSYCLEGPVGVQPGTLFVFDLWLPEDVEPRAVDGEVAGFERLPLAEVRDRLDGDAAFKTNSAVVAIDYLVRSGALDPAERGYAALVDALHRRA